MSQRRTNRLLAGLTVTLLNMCNTIKHMFEGVRPFDWLMLGIEVIVVILIGFEIFRGERSRHEEEKRLERVNERMTVIRSLMAVGQEIRRTAPEPMAHNAVNPWVEALEKWNQEVYVILESFSRQAAVSFNAGIPKGANYPGLAPVAQQYFGVLLLRLENLQNIMEKPDVY